MTAPDTLPKFFGALLLRASCGDDGNPVANANATETGTDTSTATSSDTLSPTTVVETSESSSDDTSSATGSVGSSSSTGSPISLLDRVLEAIGGRDELDALTHVRITATASRFVPGENTMPGGPPVPSDQQTVVSLDVDTGSVRNEITRTILFIPQPAPVQVTEIAQADVGGWIDGMESIFGGPPQADMLSDRYASTLVQARLVNPHVLLTRLLEDASAATEAGTAEWNGTTHELLEIASDVHPITLWVDPETDLVRRLTTLENSHMRRWRTSRPSPEARASA